MSQYIVTFYSHYEAMSLKKSLLQRGVEVLLSPVPRHLSSSCGTCARFEYESSPIALLDCEFEQLVRMDEHTAVVLHDNR